MTPLPARLLAHERLYIPWSTARPVHEIGAPLAQRVQHALNTPLTVVCPARANAPHGLASAPVVTERHGTVEDGGIVLAYCPSYELARKFVDLERSTIILVEWNHASFLGWAKMQHAYNVVTGEVHTDGLTPAGRRAVDDIIACGDLSWTDTPAKTTVRRCLDVLTALGEFSPDVVLAHARRHRGTYPIASLEKLLTDYIQRPKNTKASRWG